MNKPSETRKERLKESLILQPEISVDQNDLDPSLRK